MLSGILTTDNKPVINCCIYWVDSFECVKMHGPTNPKFKKNVRALQSSASRCPKEH